MTDLSHSLQFDFTYASVLLLWGQALGCSFYDHEATGGIQEAGGLQEEGKKKVPQSSMLCNFRTSQTVLLSNVSDFRLQGPIILVISWDEGGQIIRVITHVTCLTVIDDHFR